MNRVNCPECGYIMDGASVRCPKCRFPIGKFSESGNAEGGAIVITQEEFSALKSEMTGVRPWYTEIKDKKLVRKIIPIIIVTIILCVAAAAVVLFADSGRRGAEPQVTEMKLGRNMKLNGINAIRVKTDETAPFAAVFRDTRNDKLIQMINNLREQMYRYRLEYIKDEAQRGTLINEHENILEAIRIRDIIRAKTLMKEHIDNQELTVSQNLEGESSESRTNLKKK